MKTNQDFSDFEKNIKQKPNLRSDDFLVDLAVTLWRLEKSLLHELNGDLPIDKSRSISTLKQLVTRLEEKGLEIIDQTGQFYDEGMALRVISSEERPDFIRHLIIETVSPTVLINGNLVHAGEVVIGKPV